MAVKKAATKKATPAKKAAVKKAAAPKPTQLPAPPTKKQEVLYAARERLETARTALAHARHRREVANSYNDQWERADRQAEATEFLTAAEKELAAAEEEFNEMREGM